jgi:hypothetical protein
MLREPTHAGPRKEVAVRASTNEASVRTATVESESNFESRFILAGSSFDERFSGRSAAPSRSLQPAMSFEDRFAAAATPAHAEPPVMTATVGLAPANDPSFVAPPPAPRVAAVAPAPQPATRSIAQPTPKQTAGYRVASLSETPVPTAYASTSTEGPAKDTGITDLLKKMSLRGSTDAPHDAARQDTTPPHDTVKDALPKDPANPLGNDANRTAVYDISAHIVYMPNGDRLEAHSGLGEYMDDVHSVNMKHYGPTPPNVYDLRMREASFHGVQAIRLNPVDGSQMYGRDGILAHPFMLGPNGQSNGCVSFKDYDAFLKAFQRGEVTKMVVVERLDEAPTRTVSDWLKGIFGRT